MMSMAMVYPSQPQTMVDESPTAAAVNSNSWYRGSRPPQMTEIDNRDKVFSPAEPVVMRTATVRDVFHNEPMQGFLIIESDSEDDDDDEDDYDTRITAKSNEGSSCIIEEPIHNASPDTSVGERCKPLPQIPVYIPELQYESPKYYQDEPSSPITPTKLMSETPFLMIPTLEPIQESLDSAIEEESSFKHEEEENGQPDTDEEQDFDITTEKYECQAPDTPSMATTIPYDEKTTVEDIQEERENERHDGNLTAANDANVSHATAIAKSDETSSTVSAMPLQKPFEPTGSSSVVAMQIPHTPEGTKPPTIWSVDNVGTDNESDIRPMLRRRVSKEELQQHPHKVSSSTSLCSRCSSISSASTSALSNNELVRAVAAAHALPRTASAVSIGTHSSVAVAATGRDHLQQSHVTMSPISASDASTTQANPLRPAFIAGGPLETSGALPPHPLLQPIPVKSRLSIASFSLTHDKDAIKTYRRMARKINNSEFQMTYTKYLLDVARLYNNSKAYRATRERLLSEASYWIEKLAKRGVPEALFIKGKWHLRPEDEDCAESYRAKPQPSKALRCFHTAANMGWVEAYYELARLQKSRGESTQAVASFKRASAKGHTLATYKMAKILLRGQLQQTRNIKLGLQYLHKAADAHDSDSAEPAYVLSCVYADELDRVGIARDATMSRKNPVLALQYLHKAAKAGLPMAVHRMGQVHEHGLLNQPRDPWLGYSFYVRAAEDGHEGAMLDLSRLYAQGIPGHLMRQHEVAFKWCERAAAKGLQEAEYVLGTYYEDGIGTPPDYPLALRCYSKAASKGYAPAAERLNLPTVSPTSERIGAGPLSPAAVAEATATADPAVNDSTQSSANRLSSLRIKKQPAAERPIDDEPAVDSVKGIEQSPACHIM